MSVLRRTLSLTAAIAMAACTPAFADQLIANGGFEHGTFVDWSTFGNNNYVTTGSFDGFNAHGGIDYAVLGNIGSPDGGISQSFQDVAGQAYSFSFYLANDGKLPNNFAALFDTTALLRSVNTGVMPYTLYSYTVIGTGHDSITFLDRKDLGYFALDDVGVSTLSTVTPEPSTLALLGTGLLGAVGALRRRVNR